MCGREISSLQEAAPFVVEVEVEGSGTDDVAVELSSPEFLDSKPVPVVVVAAEIGCYKLSRFAGTSEPIVLPTFRKRNIIHFCIIRNAT